MVGTKKQKRPSSSKSSDVELQIELTRKLGDRPMRFWPVHQERSARYKFMGAYCDTGPSQHIYDFAGLKAKWQLDGNKKVFTDAQVLQFIRFAKYDKQRAFCVMKRTDPQHFQLTGFELDSQLRSKTLFPVPGLKPLDDSQSPIFCMRPSRYSPKKAPTSTIIDNLVYVMNTYATKDPENKKGMTFIANMNDWTMANFSTDYCFKFMQCLQGRSFPAEVSLFLIVNPPKWFGSVWNIMKPMLSKRFQEKVHLIPEDELGFFLEVGYERYLPDEFVEGRASTDELVQDFITFQQGLETVTRKVTKRSIFFNRVTAPSAV
jgi:hypothetical protein